MLCFILVTTSLTAVLTYLLYLLRPSKSSTYGASTSLDAFIDSSLPKVRGSKNQCERSSYSSKGRQILIMFGTEYGFSEELANVLLGRLRKLSEKSGSGEWQPRVLSAKHHQCVHWDRESVCFFIVSTCGDGVFPTDCRSLVAYLQTRCEDDLCHLHTCVLALGDSSYPHFCQAGLQLAHRLEDLGTQQVVETTRVDGEDWGVIEGWMDRVEGWVGTQAAEVAYPELRHDYLKVEEICDGGDDCGGGYSRHNPFMATLKVKQALTQVKDVYEDRETIHCQLDITGSGLTWTPGDSLGLYAENHPRDVEAVLSVLALTGREMLPLLKPAFRGQGQTTVREALQGCYDIKKATPATLSMIRQHITPLLPPHHHNTLLHPLSSKEECASYLEGRRLAQVLADCCGPHLPQAPPVDTVLSLLATLRPLQPRYYSISSSPLLAENQLSLTVAVVRFREEGGGEEGGVATTYLQDRMDIGQSLPVFLTVNPDFRLPPSPSTPILLISAGTGIAPYMAFVQDRELTNSPGEIHLYFGCRHPEKDFLYRQQIERWEARGLVCARVAFSRHQGRVYVQDLLKQDAALVWTLMEEAGGVVYVCGDAGRFAPDVEEMLIWIIQQQGQRSLDEAHSYLTQLQNAARYQKDVWLS